MPSRDRMASRDRRASRDRMASGGDSTMLIEINGIQYVITGRGRKGSNVDRKCGCLCVYQVLNEKGYWSFIQGTLKFFLHFGAVVGLLFAGAWMFMSLEDPLPEEPVPYHGMEVITPSKAFQIETSKLWTGLENKYNISVNESVRGEVLEKLKRIKLLKEEKRRALVEKQQGPPDRHYIRLKWFYFSFIATTTIGYGDVMPMTYHGRLFYIFFSIIGIGISMTLLRRCGEILSVANKKLYVLCIRYTCWENAPVSETLLAFISLIIIFLGFLVVVIWYDMTAVRPDHPWSPVDVVYFWIMTFTTVGFGSEIDLEVELKHVYGLMLCRVFGLAFLAGIIDALVVYLRYRQGLCEESAKVLIYGKEEEEEEDECPKCHQLTYNVEHESEH